MSVLCQQRTLRAAPGALIVGLSFIRGMPARKSEISIAAISHGGSFGWHVSSRKTSFPISRALMAFKQQEAIPTVLHTTPMKLSRRLLAVTLATVVGSISLFLASAKAGAADAIKIG